MSSPHHHVYNALQREIYRSVPVQQLLPILLDKGVIQEDIASQIRRSPSIGIKILVGHLRNQDFKTFLNFLECICIAHETPEGGSKVEKSIVVAIGSVVADFDQKHGTKYTAEVDEIVGRFQKLSTLEEPEQSGETTGTSVRSETEEAIEPPSCLPFLPYTQTPPTSITFTANGGERELVDLDISVHAPRGVVHDGDELKLEIGACCYGPFSIPDKYLIATAFYSIITNTRPRKPLHLTMGHCLQMPVYQKSNHVLVLKADHRVVSGSDKYVFERLTHPEISDISPYLSFEIQDFCILCGVIESSPEQQQSSAATVLPPTIASFPRESPSQELSRQHSMEEKENQLVPRGNSTDSEPRFLKSDSTDSEILKSTSIDPASLSQRRSALKRRHSNELSVECTEKRRRLVNEYCVLLFEPKDKGKSFSVFIYVCLHCHVSIKVWGRAQKASPRPVNQRSGDTVGMKSLRKRLSISLESILYLLQECQKQAKNNLTDLKEPAILQVIFEGPEISFVATHNGAHEDVIFTPKISPAVVLESEIQRPSVSKEMLQGLVQTKVYPPRIEFEVYNNSYTQRAKEYKIFLSGVSRSDSLSKDIYFTVIVPGMQQSLSEQVLFHQLLQRQLAMPEPSYQLYRQLAMPEPSYQLSRQLSKPLEEYLSELSYDQRDKEVTEQIMPGITHYVSNWRMTGRSLHLSEEKLEQIRCECRENNDPATEYVYQVLFWWKRECQMTPTVAELLELLYNAHEYKAVEKLIQCCKHGL